MHASAKQCTAISPRSCTSGIAMATEAWSFKLVRHLEFFTHNSKYSIKLRKLGFHGAAGALKWYQTFITSLRSYSQALCIHSCSEIFTCRGDCFNLSPSVVTFLTLNMWKARSLQRRASVIQGASRGELGCSCLQPSDNRGSLLFRIVTLHIVEGDEMGDKESWAEALPFLSWWAFSYINNRICF